MNATDVIFTENTDVAVYEKAFPKMVDNIIAGLVSIKDDCEDISLDPNNQFASGVYARELSISKGSLIVGKVHKTEHFNIISKGDISVATKDGIMRIQAPYTFVSKAGIQKVVFAHEDTVWTTIHATNETDIDKLENELVEEGSSCLLD